MLPPLKCTRIISNAIMTEFRAAVNEGEVKESVWMTA